jgi:hypothetical protein
MKKNALSLIFRIEKALGRGDLFDFLFHFPDGSTTEKQIQHEFYDGLGALIEESRQWSGSELKIPSFQLKGKLSFKDLLEGLLGLKDDLTPSKTRWKFQNEAAEYCYSRPAWRVFSETTTQSLIELAKVKNISLSSLLLFEINAAVAEHLLAREQRDCRWLIPVNMRRSDKEKLRTDNHTSSVGIRFDRQAQVSEVDSAYRRSINKWRALASHALTNASTFLGEQQLMQLARRRGITNSWIGSFSNLGVWNFQIAADEHHWPLAISFAPPAGTPCFPVGVGIVTWQKHLSVSIRLHSSLKTNNSASAEDLLNALASALHIQTGEPLEKIFSSESHVDPELHPHEPSGIRV